MYKITHIMIKAYIINRCNERIKVSQLLNRDVDLYEKAMLLKFNMQNVLSPRSICKYLLDNMDVLKDIITKAAPYSKNWKAYQNKLEQLEALREYAESYVSVGAVRQSIDCMVMRRGI